MDGLIIQVIAWHHYLATISEVSKNDNTFDTAFALWDGNQNKTVNNKKLTITLVSQLTAIPFETTRRKINRLKEKKWIFYSKEKGIIYNSNSQLNDKIINVIHPVEKDLLKEFLVAYLLSGD